MTSVNVYLTFNGNCEEAFNFYKKAFGGDFVTINRFAEMPPQAGMPEMTDADKNKIMHVSLPISKETSIMGSDAIGQWSSGFAVGNNFSISINVDSTQEADRLYKELSAGGQQTMSMEATFWGSYFGMFVDKFGISWMVSAEAEKE